MKTITLITLLTFLISSTYGKTYGTANLNEGGIGLLKTSDNGYLLLGSQVKNIPFEDQSAYVVKVNSNLDEMWSITYGDGIIDPLDSSVGYWQEVAVDAIEVGNGYIIVGNKYSPIGHNIEIHHISFNGSTVWKKVIHNTILLPTQGGIIDITEVNPNDYCIHLIAEEFNPYFSYDIYINIDTLGNQIAQNIPVYDSDYPLFSTDYNSYISALDSTGGVLWTTYLPLAGIFPNKAQVTNQGDLCIVGFTIDTLNNNETDLWFTVFDNNGNIITTTMDVTILENHPSDVKFAIGSAPDGLTIITDAFDAKYVITGLNGLVFATGNVIPNKEINLMLATGIYFVTLYSPGLRPTTERILITR